MMESGAPKEPEELKNIVINAKEPVVFKNKLHWGLLQWTLEDWGRLFQNQELSFRCGKNAFTNEPQWERRTHSKKATFQEFISFAAAKPEQWMYFDYKYLSEWFSDIEDLKKNIDWGCFGFPKYSSTDSTIWIGSAGAHTPCHMDTYGCNLVAQVYGRKQWLLFPPEEDLKPTRIPYEESSVYSKLNFFSPDMESFKDVGSCRRVILEPGDVLLVPHKWWHYVENLDIAISINVWVPLPIDNEERLKESLVQFLVFQVTKDVGKDVKKIILNPNTDEVLENASFKTAISTVSECQSVCRRSNATTAAAKVQMYPFLQSIPQLPSKDFQEFLLNQRNRFNERDEGPTSNDHRELVDLVNAFTHPEVISLIRNKLL